MYYQQTRENILIRNSQGHVYADTLANATLDGFVIPFLDQKFDYRIYEKDEQGNAKRHVLSGKHGEIHEGGKIPWDTGDEAFNDLSELIERQKKRIKDAKPM